MYQQIKQKMKPVTDKIENILKFGKYTRTDGSDGKNQGVQIKNIRGLDECIKMGQFGINSKAPIGTRAVIAQIGNEKIIIANEHFSSVIDVTSGNTVIYNATGSFIKLEDGVISFKCDSVEFDCDTIKHRGVSIDNNHIHTGDSGGSTTKPIN